MKRLLLAMTLLSSPAMALQFPTPGKVDPRICDVTYDENDVTAVTSVVGDTITLRLGPSEHILKVTASDEAHTKLAQPYEESNILYLKPTYPMPPQPIAIATRRDDGTRRDYALQWTALSDEKPKLALAATAPVQIQETPTLNTCYIIRFNYPSDVKAQQIAAWRAMQARKIADQAEIALHKREQDQAHNVRYLAQGDASIAPARIYDDGNTTTLIWPGNMHIPVILTRLEDKKTDAEVSGFTVEEGGVVKIHEVLPFIRLRDGDKVLCITNLGFSAVGANPATGTTKTNIERAVGK